MGASYAEKIQAHDDEHFYAAIQKYNPNAQLYSTYTKDSTTAEDITIDRLNELASNVHSDLNSVLQLNAMIRKAAVLNGYVGKTLESIYANCNTEYRLVWPDAEGRNKKKVLDSAKLVIEDFLRQISAEELIRDGITTAYAEGNRYLFLRIEGGNYIVSKLPLGITYMSDYNVNGVPALEINLKSLENGLKKTYQTSGKTRKPLYMKNVEEDIKQNFPQVYQQWKAGDTVARLDVDYSGVIRVGNIGRKFGVSPIAKGLKDVIVLENMAKADVTTSRVKQRTLLVQLLRKDILGSDGQRKGIAQAEYAHASLMNALSTSSSVITCAPFVEDIKYCAPPNEDNSKDKTASYTRSLLMSLGIGFIDVEGATATGSRISIGELLKTINSIAESVEAVFNKWFKLVLTNNNIPLEYCPRIKIMDSNAMDFDMRKDLSDFLFNKLSASRQTAFEVLGVADYATERSRRETENADGVDEIFTPHSTAFNKTSDPGTPGRPAANDPDDEDRQKEDKTNNDSK